MLTVSHRARPLWLALALSTAISVSARADDPPPAPATVTDGDSDDHDVDHADSTPAAVAPTTPEPAAAAVPDAPPTPQLPVVAVSEVKVVDDGNEIRLLAGFDEGFGLERKDGAFKATAGFLGIFDFTASGTDSGGRSAFLLRMARPNLKVSALDKRLELFVQPELAGAKPGILDMQLTFAPVKSFWITAGQFIVPNSRAFITPVPKLQFVDFGVVEDEFRAGRDVGVSVNGAIADGLVELSGGIFNGNALSSRLDHGWMWVARAAVNPFGAVAYDQTQALKNPDGPPKLALAFNAYQRDGERSTTIVDNATNTLVTKPLPDQQDLVLGPDAYFVWGPFSILGEGYWRARSTPGLDDTVNAVGGYVQSGIFVVPSFLEIVARAGAMDRNIADDAAGFLASYEGGLNIYPLGNHLKLQARYQLNHIEVAAGAQPTQAITLQTQIQL